MWLEIWKWERWIDSIRDALVQELRLYPPSRLWRQASLDSLIQTNLLLFISSCKSIYQALKAISQCLDCINETSSPAHLRPKGKII